MNRSMDKFRIPQGIFLLSNVLLIPLPVVSIWQENYPEQVYSQLSFVQGYLISRTGVGASPASGFAPFMTVLLVVLPLVLAIFAGVCTLVEQFYGKYVRVAGVVSLCLYLCQFFVGTIFLCPKRLNTAPITGSARIPAAAKPKRAPPSTAIRKRSAKDIRSFPV